MDNNEIPPYDIPFNDNGIPPYDLPFDSNENGETKNAAPMDANANSENKPVLEEPSQNDAVSQENFSEQENFAEQDASQNYGDFPPQENYPEQDGLSGQEELYDNQSFQENQMVDEGVLQDAPAPAKSKKTGAVVVFIVIIGLLFVVLCGALAYMYSSDMLTADNSGEKVEIMELSNNEAEDLNGLSQDENAQLDPEMKDLADEGSVGTGVEITRNNNRGNTDGNEMAPNSQRDENYPPLPGAKNQDNMKGEIVAGYRYYSDGGMGRLDPFNPRLGSNEDMFEIIVPPVDPSPDLETQMLMSLRISGIMYTPESPSAIINIAGQDQLVRKGDEFNNFKVMNITKDKVTVKSGANVYTASVGEVLRIEQVGINSIPNLNKKFAGPYSKGNDKIIEINMID